MANNIDELGIDVSPMIEAINAAESSLKGLALTSDNILEVIKRINPAGDVLGATMKLLSSNGNILTATFEAQIKQIEKEGKVVEELDKKLKLVSATSKAINANPIKLDSENAGNSVKANAFFQIPADFGGTVAQVNNYNNQLERLGQIGTQTKAPLDQLFNLIAATPVELAQAEGEVRKFADQVLRLREAAANTSQEKLSGLVGQKFATQIGNPQQITDVDFAKVTAGYREITDAAIKAGLTQKELNNFLSQGNGVLSSAQGKYFDVGQAAIALVGIIDRLKQKQAEANTEELKSQQIQGAKAATTFASQTFFGPKLTGTTDEIAKTVSALDSLTKAAERSNLPQAALEKIYAAFAQGIPIVNQKYADLAVALARVEKQHITLGVSQRAANVEDQKRIQTLQQQSVALTAINNLQVKFPVPAGASAETINQYSASLGRLQNVIAASNLSSADIGKILNASINQTGEVFSGVANKVQIGANSVVNSFAAMQRSITATKDPLKDTETKFEAFFSRVGSQITTILINQLYHAFTQGVEAARLFGIELTQSVAITQDVGGSYEKFRDQVLEVSNTFGIARQEVAAGLFQTLKHEIGDAAESAKFLAEAAQFARVSNSSFVDSVNLGTAAINSFGLQGQDTHVIFATLFEAIKSGRLSVGELANTLGTLGTIGNSVGISMAETTAALSALTHSGVNATQSQTFLRNLFKELITPTKAMTEHLHELGFETGAAAAETLGLAGFLRTLDVAADGNIAVTGKLVNNLRGIQALLGLTGSKFDVFIHQLNKTKNAQEDYAAGTNVTIKSASQVFTEFQNQIVNQSAKIGDAIVSLTGNLITTLGGVETTITTLKEVFAGFSVAAFILAIESAIAVLTVLKISLYSVTAAALSNPLTAVAVIAGVSVGLLIKYLDVLDAAEQASLKAHRDVLEARIKAEGEFIAKVKETSDGQLKIINTQVANIQQIYNRLHLGIVKDFEDVNAQLKNLVDLDVKVRSEAINKIKSEETKAETEVANLIRDVGLGKLAIQDRIFEESVRNLTLSSEIAERELRANELTAAAIEHNKEAKAAAAQQDISTSIKLEEISKREFNEASKQLDKIASASAKIKDLSAGYSAALLAGFKKDFELQVKLVNDSEKRVLDTFKRVKDAVKDIFDKTGDASGESTKFLKDFVKQLTTYLNEIKGLNGRVRISTRGSVEVDPDTRRLLDALDPKTIKRLRFAVQSGDQEGVKRILGDAETVLKKLDEIRKARAANDAEIRSSAEANAARSNKDFANERRALQDAADFALKSEAQGFKGGGKVQSELLTIRNRILQSYKDEAEAKGTVNKKADDAFNTQLRIEGVLEKQRALMLEQVKAQTGLSAEMEKQAGILKDQVTSREEELASVKALFQRFDSIKPGKNDTKEELKAELDKVNDLANDINNNAGGLKFKDPKIELDVLTKVNEKRAALEREFNLRDRQEKAESARVAIAESEKAKLEGVKALQDVLNKLRADSDAEALKDLRDQLAEEQRLVKGALADDGTVALSQDTIKAKQLRIAELKKEILDFSAALPGQLEQIKRYNQTLEDIKNNKLTQDDIARLAVLTGKRTNIFTIDLEAETKKLTALGIKINTDLNQTIEPKLKTDSFKSGVEELKQALNDLQDNAVFGLQLKRLQQTPIKKNFGGLISGPSGIDQVPAMLSSGEFVVDATNTSRFFNQLNQIRSGRAPTTNSSSVNFGGININLQGSGNSQTDARAIVSEIQRLQARGLVKL